LKACQLWFTSFPPYPRKSYDGAKEFDWWLALIKDESSPSGGAPPDMPFPNEKLDVSSIGDMRFPIWEMWAGNDDDEQTA